MNRRFCVAPMMDLTDRHDRYLLRLLSQHALLYTEMVTCEALLNNDPTRLLSYNTEEHPLALQLGGSDPLKLAQCTQIAEQAGFDEVNLNVGCPSDRVQSGLFGACLMLQPELVAQCFTAMQQAANIPISIKCRIGVDDQDEVATLPQFIETLAKAGCGVFIIHARKAWLKGLSPKQNRDIPPLDYELVHSIKKQFPKLEIIINGGLCSIEESLQQLPLVDGVMLGRTAYYEPFLLAEVDEKFYGTESSGLTRDTVFEQYCSYAEQQMTQGVELKYMAKHALGLFHGLPGARAFRRYISENIYKENAGIDVLHEAHKKVEFS